MAATPPGPVEPGKSSLFMDLFSLGSVIMIIVTCSCLSFIFEVDFSETYLVTSAKNSVSEPPNLKFFLDPPTRLVPSALAIMPLVTKNLATSLGNGKKKISCVTLKYHSNPGKEKET